MRRVKKRERDEKRPLGRGKKRRWPKKWMGMRKVKGRWMRMRREEEEREGSGEKKGEEEKKSGRGERKKSKDERADKPLT